MDQELFFLINREWTNPTLDKAMAITSSWALWWPLLVPLILWVAWKGGFRGRAFIVCTALVFAINDGLVTQSMKKMVQRPRPYEQLAQVRVVDLERASPRILAVFKEPRVRESGYNFKGSRGRAYPSGHVSNNFALAVLICVFLPRWGWLYFFPALLVSYSRIYNGSHWPSDVAGSAFQGAGITLLILATLSLVWQLKAPKWFPKLAQQHPQLLPT
ncbi:MAG: phosphatase PAP2 family protein [Verrucomicrobiales bacterium]